MLKYGKTSVTVKGQGLLDRSQIELATIIYELQGENAESASNIVTTLIGEDGESLGSESIGSIFGCKSRSGYFNYKCADKGTATLKLETAYNGKTPKTISKEINVTCEYGSKKPDGSTDESPLQYCKIDKAISPDDGTVKISDGEQIKFFFANLSTDQSIT
ncbi:MAG TPA: hypothetical protein P5052_02890 [Candidatus Paceibacterota bacterium]|nr:hypothetical protein [Candidatus Paceibacterota bacterium]HRZ29679.1 hypothetical protein [Candidatus Paceibacterota bacterium]